MRGRHATRAHGARVPGGAVLALAAAAVVGAGLVPLAARAATLNMSADSLATGTGVVAQCGPVGGFSVLSGYSGGRYQVTSVQVSSVPVGCFGRAYQLTFYDTVTKASYGEVQGVLPASATASLPVAPGMGPDLATIPGSAGVTIVVSS